MDQNQQISNVIQKRLGGEYSVDTRVNYWQYDVDSKADAGFVLLVKNPLIESNPEQAKNDILKALSEIEPLKPFMRVESETNHMERLAKELEYFREQEMAVNATRPSDPTSFLNGKPMSTIHDKAPEWFRELPKREGWNIKHALNVTKTDTGTIKIKINIPKDVVSEDIVKNIQNRKAAILEALAERVVKYTPTADTKEKKEALRAQVKGLDVNIAAQSENDSKSVYIYIVSPEQMAASKEPGGITADKIEALNLTNPLLALQNGEDDQTPGKPQPHLQKALARAILHADVYKAAEIFPYIAGKDDMRRQVGKSLSGLKAKSADNPELVKRIDAFLNDAVFKDQSQWGKPLEKQEDLPEAPKFYKSTGDYNDPAKPYEPGVMRVEIKVPADKFPAIRDQLAALDTAAAGQVASTAQNDGSLKQAIHQEIKPLVDVMVGVINNQKDLAAVVNAVQTQQLASPAPAQQAGVLDRAATAMTAAANRLMSWVDRMESRAPIVNTVLSSDEAMANTILAAAGVMATPDATLAGAIAAAGPTSLLNRADKTAGEQQLTLGA